MSAALDWLESFTWERIWAHQWPMREYMVQQIARPPALTLLSLQNSQGGGVMVTFAIPGITGEDTIAYTDMMWREHHIYLRPSSIANGIRLSAAYFTTTDDVDRYFEIVDCRLITNSSSAICNLRSLPTGPIGC